MSDKKDKSAEDKRAEFEESLKPSLKDVFDAVSDFGRDITREAREYGAYFGKGEFIKDTAEYVRKHGKDRLKTGAATAAKVGATTWKTGPLLKLTLPAAFAAGAIGGPRASRYIADKLDKAAEKMPKFDGSSEDSAKDVSDCKEPGCRPKKP